jgi:hypothetical protein
LVRALSGDDHAHQAHNSAPTSNAAPGSPTGVGGGIGPVLPMFCAASARQTNDVPTHTHQKPTESFSRGSLPLLTSYTFRSKSRGRRGVVPTAAYFMGKTPPPRSEMHVAQDRRYAAFREHHSTTSGE